MIGGIAELDIDRGDPFEVMPDVQFVAHAHASVKLDGLLGNEARGIAHLRFRAGRQFRPIWLSGGEAEVQMLGERNRFFERDEHVDHAVLQDLKRPESHPELLTHFTVVQRRGIQHRHRTDRFGAKGCDGAIAGHL